MTLFLQLFLAHIVGDFFFQFGKWVRDKELKKWKSAYLYLHVLIHFILIIITTASFSIWKIALVLCILHLIIDGVKLQFQQPATRRKWFFIDQGLHLITIIVACFIKEKIKIDWSILSNPDTLAFITALLFLLNPASFIIKTIISKWIPAPNSGTSTSLQNAGQWIGFMERLLIFIFILIGKWEGIGFLLAAKSIFRFGDLKDAKDMKLTEYVLIGTLLSFGLAIVISHIAAKIIQPLPH